MRLFTKIAITMAAAVLIGTVASATAVALIFVPQYLEMDHAAALANTERVYEYLQTELDTTAAHARDWGNWDDTFKFAKDLNRDYIQNNLKQEDLENLGVDEYTLVGYDRQIRFHVRTDRSAGAARMPFDRVRHIPARYWHTFTGKPAREAYAGYTQTTAGPALVAAVAITDSNGNGPSPGVLYFSKMMSEAFLASAREKTRVDFVLAMAGPVSTSGAEVRHLSQAGNIPVVMRRSNDHVTTAVVLKDVSGTPSLRLTVSTPARFARMAQQTLWLMLGVLFAISAIAGLVIAAFMRQVVTRPLERIIGHSETISSTGNLDRSLNLRRSDEIGALAQAFDRMIGELREARLRLQEQSYVSGMANVAAEMLHNIRNSLSPLSTAIWKGRESLKDVRADRLTQASAALSAAEIEPERQAKLVEYVGASAKHISERCHSADAAFETIHGFTNQIELVLKHHEELSRGERYTEAVSLGEVAAAAAKICVRANAPAIEIEMDEALAQLPPVTAQRVVLLQVLGNLVVNAVQSITRANVVPGRITFGARDLGHAVELSVRDNGEGISSEHRSRLFQRGFTTSGGSGLGLHYCATSLNAMNGSITAESEGAGKGAVFRIVLPIAERKGKAA